jgi:hypothetical protein
MPIYVLKLKYECHSVKMQWLDAHLPYLTLLARTHVKQRKLILESSTNKQLSVICEIIFNFLNGVIPVEPEEIKNFAKNRNILRKLGQKTKNHDRKYIIKHSAAIKKFLTFILPKFE